MKGSYLRCYMRENQKHGHVLLYEWMLENAKQLGIHGGSVFRAIAGFGRHGTLHEQHFFELAGDLTLQVEFLVSDEDADRLIAIFRKEKLHLVVATIPAEIELINGDS